MTINQPYDRAIKLAQPLTCSGCGDPAGWVALATRWESGIWTFFVLCSECEQRAHKQHKSLLDEMHALRDQGSRLER